jgi:hypothetical protein
MLEEVHRAQPLGVHLLAGTDLTIPYTDPGFSLHDELKLFVEAGLTPTASARNRHNQPVPLSRIVKNVGPRRARLHSHHGLAKC